MPNHVTNINTFKGVSEEKPKEKIKVVLVKPMQKPQIVEIDTSLETMQEVVGGLIEQVMPFDESNEVDVEVKKITEISSTKRINRRYCLIKHWICNYTNPLVSGTAPKTPVRKEEIFHE